MKKSRILPAVSLPSVLLCAALALASGAFGGVPQTISYQGYLTDDAGAPLTGPVAITFRLFDQLTEGTEAWAETHETVQLDDGRFSVGLGEVTALPADVGQLLYLEIEVNGQTLSPRLPLRSVPYALQAGTVDAGGVNTDAVVDDAIGKAKLAGDIADAGLAQNADGSLRVAVEGINATMIAKASITNQHIAASANIAPEKIAGTAATLGGTETLTNKTLDNPVITVQDSDLTIVDDGDPGYSVRLQLSIPTRTALQRTLTLPDADGTIALESYVDAQIADLADVATSGSFLDLSDVPGFAVLDGLNTFTATGAAITFNPVGADADTVLLQVLATTGTLEGSPLFRVDTEGDVFAETFSGNGAGLTNLQSSALTGLISLGLIPPIPVSGTEGFAAVASSGSFNNLSDVPDFARRDTANVFTATEYALSLEPIDPPADAVLLQVMPQSLGRTGYAGSAVFTVDAEGDVVATSFSGTGTGLLNLDADNLASGTIPYNRLPVIYGDKLANSAVDGNALKDGSVANADVAADAAIAFSKIDVGNGAVLNQMLLNDSFGVSLDSNLTTTTTTVALGGTLDLAVNTTNLSETMAGWGLKSTESQLAIDSTQLLPSLATDLAGKGLLHDTDDDTLAVSLGLGLTLDGSNAVIPDVDDATISVNGDGKLAVIGVTSVPVVLDTNEPGTPTHGSLIFKDGVLQVYNDPDHTGEGTWIKIGTYQ